jgi:NAD(P)-dependent dehydrogenase (short-subunit alcohol dehydrogenase family)
MESAFFEGKVVVVVGAGGGIGAACARELASRGAKLVLCDASADALAAAGRQLSGGACISTAGDFSKEEQVESTIAAALDRWGCVDMVVNSAGISLREKAIEQSVENWQRTLDVNMTSVFLMSRAAAREMVARKIPGSIVSISSIMGFRGGRPEIPNVAYQGTKAAVINMTRAMAVEWGPFGIRVNAVAPTWVRTPLIADHEKKPGFIEHLCGLMPLGRIAEPEEVAAAVTFLLGSDSAMITGHTLPVDGGYLA